MRIGEIIKNKRNELNLTQEELATKLHVTRQAISNWENSKSVPDIEFVRQLADEFGMSIDEMLINEVQNEVKRVEKRSRNNSIAIVVISIVLTMIFLGVVLPAILYLSFAPVKSEYIGPCDQIQVEDVSVQQFDNVYVINTYEEIQFEDFYCIPVTYELTLREDLLTDNNLIEERFLDIELPRPFDLLYPTVEYTKLDSGFSLDIILTVDRNDDWGETEARTIVIENN